MSHYATFRACGIVIAVAIVAASCSQEPEYTDTQRGCIAQRYPKYDVAKLNQCVDVCINCMRGTTTTCTTSCNLKGAS
jgi:hypothetical protein